jgi:sugar phosphate permease
MVGNSLSANRFFVALAGLATSFAQPALVQYLGGWFSRRRLSLVIACWSMNAPLGLFNAVMAEPLRGDSFWISQRGAVRLSALLVVALSVVFVVFAGDRPVEFGQKARSLRESHRALISRRTVWITVLGAVVASALESAYPLWLGLVLKDEYGYSLRSIALVVGAWGIAGIAGTFVIGYLASYRFGSRWHSAACLSFVAIALAFASWPMTVKIGTGCLSLVSATAGAATHGLVILLRGSAAYELGTPGAHGTAIGFVSGLAALAVLFTPALTAPLIEHWSWLVPLLIGGAALLAAALTRMYGSWLPNEVDGEGAQGTASGT